MHTKIELDYCGRPLCLDLGKVAHQADGAVLVRFGETVVIATAVASKDVREDIDFFPLTVDYQEKTFAAGRIPGGFFKREGRPSEREILTCRLIDRSIRPLFAGGVKAETQIIVTVLSADGENDTDVVAMLAASVALEISDIPFAGPLAGVRVGRINGEWVMNPLQTEMSGSDVNIFLSGTRDGILMVEGGAAVVPEEGVLDALFQGHQAIQPLLELQEKLKDQLGKPKRVAPQEVRDEALTARVRDLAGEKLKEAVRIVKGRSRAPSGISRSSNSGTSCCNSASASTDAGSRTCAPSPARSACCHALTGRRSSHGVRPRPWWWPLSVRRPTFSG